MANKLGSYASEHKELLPHVTDIERVMMPLVSLTFGGQIFLSEVVDYHISL